MTKRLLWTTDNLKVSKPLESRFLNLKLRWKKNWFELVIYFWKIMPRSRTHQGTGRSARSSRKYLLYLITTLKYKKYMQVLLHCNSRAIQTDIWCQIKSWNPNIDIWHTIFLVSEYLFPKPFIVTYKTLFSLISEWYELLWHGRSIRVSPVSCWMWFLCGRPTLRSLPQLVDAERYPYPPVCNHSHASNCRSFHLQILRSKGKPDFPPP